MTTRSRIRELSARPRQSAVGMIRIVRSNLIHERYYSAIIRYNNDVWGLEKWRLLSGGPEGKQRKAWDKVMFSDRVIQQLLILTVIGTYLSWPLDPRCEPALQQADAKKTATTAEQRPASSLLVNKAPLAAAMRCAISALEKQGWSFLPSHEQGMNVLPSEKERKELLAIRELRPDELRRDADTSQHEGSEGVQGRANLNLNFSPANGNATRIDARLRIVAEAATPVPVLRPSNWSPLRSTGVLEKEVLVALQSHCGPARKLPLAEHGASRRRDN
jgi:hypothetical protein